MWLGVAVLGAVLLFWAILDTKKPTNFPPGPRWWPLFGSVFFLRDLLRRTGCQYLAWKTLARQFGLVCGMRVGLTHHLVLVSGRTAVAQVLESEDFDGRPSNFSSQFRTMGKKRGVLTTEGTCWIQHRQFLIGNIDTFIRTDGLISEEVQKSVNKLYLNGKQSIVLGTLLHQTFQISVLNILWKWISGVRFEDDDPSRVKFLQMSKDFLHMPDETDESFRYIPELQHVLGRDSTFSQFAKVHVQIWTKLSEMVWEHKPVTSEKQTSLIDIYLNEMRESNKIEASHFSEMQLVALIKDIIGAGSQTSSTAISYAIFLMLTHQRIQAKVQNEIDEVIGRSRPVLLSDIPRLPYVNAVLMEAHRISTVTSTTFPHRAVRDTKIAGYSVPEDTTVLVNLWSVHMDKQHWGDPGVFRPERFLDEFDGLKLDPWCIPFGLGRRRCLGEKMAWNILFLSFSLCLQQLEFSVSPGSKTKSFFTGPNDFTEMLEHVNVIISSR